MVWRKFGCDFGRISRYRRTAGRGNRAAEEYIAVLPHKLAIEVYTRDNFKCRHCGWRNGIHAHHLVYKSKGGQDDINNLITLCFVCHEAVHGRKLLINFLDKEDAQGVISFKRQGNWKPR